MSKFNKFQELALDTPISKNLMISAGAGSGKTAVLSEKVERILTSGEIKPNEILVLTFTDAAAFEMKERIIKKVKEKDKDLAEKLLSAQISTFDSFSSYLVRRYGKELNISPTFQIVSEIVMDVKKNEFIEELFDELYQEKDPLFFDLIRKTSYKNDDGLKSLLKDFDSFISGLSLKDEDYFLNHYNFLDEDFIKNAYIDFSLNLVNIFLTAREEFKFNSVSYDLANPKENDNYNQTLASLDQLLDPLQSGDYDSFKQSLNAFKFDTINRKASKPYKEERDKLKKVIIDDNLKILKKYPNVSEALEIAKDFKGANSYLIKMEKRLKEKLENYKKINSSYTFNDISKASLRILVEPEFKDIKEEIASTYKYILVDEYQDTNDIQEEFIESLKKNSTFFIVGDIKQSIYRFRRANPSLFTERKERYIKDETNSVVIDMNINYRSFKKILDLVNIFFRANMSKDVGGVEFSDSEALHYDLDANIYDENKLVNKEPAFSMIRSFSFNDQAELSDVKEEALLIINDILSKVQNKYQIYDKDNKEFRDAKYSDFAILAKRGTNFNVYKEMFNNFNIPLNLIMEEDIKDINSVIVIESILKSILDLLENNTKEYLFNYLSLARSYLYEYSDEKIYNAVKDESYLKDQIFIDLFSFLKKHNDSSILDIYLDLLDEFKIIAKLNKLGNINSNINRIESFGVIVSSLKERGSTLSDLLSLLEAIDKYKVDFKASSSIDNKDSVLITTIHKSKGLQYKIVYLPLNESNYHLRSNSKSASKKYGILYKGYKFGDYYETIFDFLEKEIEKKEDLSEYMRLLYVAFTRAEEKLIFVKGNYEKDNSIYEYLTNAFDVKYKMNYEIFDLIEEKTGVKTPKVELEEVEEFLNFRLDFNLRDVEKERAYQEFDVSYYVDKFNKYLEELKSITQKEYKKPFSDKFADGFINISLDKVKIKEKQNKLVVAMNKFFKVVYFQAFILLYDKDLVRNITLDKERRSYRSIFKYENSISLSLFLLYLRRKYNKEFLPFLTQSFTSLEEFKMDNFLFLENDLLLDNPIKEARVSNETHDFKEKKNLRASHKLEESDEDFYVSNLLKAGIHLHYLMELYDFKSKDLSYIESKKEYEIIKKVTELDLFKEAQKAKVYKEYEYFLDNQKGIIDLLLVYEDHIDIVDYKTKNIEDEAYPRQLGIYKENIARLFKQDETKINTYLVSLLEGTVKKVN